MVLLYRVEVEAVVKVTHSARPQSKRDAMFSLIRVQEAEFLFGGKRTILEKKVSQHLVLLLISELAFLGPHQSSLVTVGAARRRGG